MDGSHPPFRNVRSGMRKGFNFYLGRSLRRFMGRKQGVDRKEPGGLAPCSICDAVMYPTPWQVPVQGESSWFLLVSGEGSTVPFTFSYLARRFLHAWDWRRLHSLHRWGTCPVSVHPPRGWISDLFSSQQRQELGGSPVKCCLCPWRRSNQSGIL